MPLHTIILFIVILICCLLGIYIGFTFAFTSHDGERVEKSNKKRSSKKPSLDFKKAYKFTRQEGNKKLKNRIHDQSKESFTETFYTGDHTELIKEEMKGQDASYEYLKRKSEA